MFIMYYCITVLREDVCLRSEVKTLQGVVSEVAADAIAAEAPWQLIEGREVQ